jgi:hypothetical protein
VVTAVARLELHAAGRPGVGAGHGVHAEEQRERLRRRPAHAQHRLNPLRKPSRPALAPSLWPKKWEATAGPRRTRRTSRWAGGEDPNRWKAAHGGMSMSGSTLAEAAEREWVAWSNERARAAEASDSCSCVPVEDDAPMVDEVSLAAAAANRGEGMMMMERFSWAPGSQGSEGPESREGGVLVWFADRRSQRPERGCWTLGGRMRDFLWAMAAEPAGEKDFYGA